MRVMLLVTAAAALSAMTIVPAAAEGTGGSSSGWHHNNNHHNHHNHHRNSWARVDFRRFAIPDSERKAHSHDGHGHGGGSFGYGYGDYGYAYVDETAFRSDGYNDWWHDRPDRAYPRWVQSQRGAEACEADRMWWHGSTLSC